MIVELPQAERAVTETRYGVGKSTTLAWRAFGKVLGIPVQDPRMVMDGDGSQYEPITKRLIYMEEARDGRFLSLGHYGCWDGGAMRSLSPCVTYVSYNVASDGSFVNFHGWYRPRKESQIIVPKPPGDGPYLTQDGLFSITVLIGVMRRLIARAECG